MQPQSCDTFVAMPSVTSKGCIIFGKNSDRPCEEVQEVVYVPAKDYEAGSKLQVKNLAFSTGILMLLKQYFNSKYV